MMEGMPSKSIPTDGQAIRRRRILAGYTTTDLAEQAGISQGYLVHIERGQRFGRPPVLKRIADALGCGIEDIVDQEKLAAA